jgi:ketosteroid isomerase-like protein
MSPTSFHGVIALAGAVALAPAASAQWSRVHEQFYLPAAHNWAFRRSAPAADRLFNAFDYGHAILYEMLLTRKGGAVARLEGREFDYLTTQLLVNPPRLPLEDMAIAPHYVRLVPEARAMFEWAHILHRQSYDILADSRLNDGERDARMRELLAHYRSRPDLRLSEKPKNMSLMQEQPYSLAFRRDFPKFNGLIWAYHWLQIGLYEPLLLARTPDERQTLIDATINRFRQMLTDAPRTMPYVMPMTPSIAPTFAGRYPELAIIFDNLHSMHDVISDILANPGVPAARKREEILLAARRYRDDTTADMSVAGWVRMAAMMGIGNQGGPAVGFAASLPTPTVERGAVMRHDDEGNMLGNEHAGHVTPAPSRASAAVTPSSGADSLAVLRVVENFHSALARGDSAAALGSLDDDVEILEAGGRETKERYRSGHLAGDISFARAAPSERTVHRVMIAGDVAWISSSSRARGTVNGRPVDSIGAELMVLARRGTEWKIVAIHWSSRRPSSPG